MIQKIARTGLSHAQAQFMFNEARSKPGQFAQMIEQADGNWTVVVTWDDAGPAPALRRSGPVAADEEELGSLSSRFESNGDPAAIGRDSTGGFSYGAYQIATLTGTMGKFLDFLSKKFPELSAELENAGGAAAARAGDENFKETWRKLAARPEFFRSQHDFIEHTHYRPFAVTLLGKPGLDLSQRSSTLRDVAWSVAVQHGPANKVFANALGGMNLDGLSDAEIVKAVYAERMKLERYFPSSTDKVKSALTKRFEQELRLALDRLS
ncbi:VgrG-related protein [Azohydromonas aeria]|uniref:VgrG-related protein n=1 Tax=Azohydromonas aeria TaxID=2590212 RepID=UPI0012F9B071|nr:hypothetical protein [Azohydromonas aeria]